jgi:hypothetical protein
MNWRVHRLPTRPGVRVPPAEFWTIRNQSMTDVGCFSREICTHNAFERHASGFRNGSGAHSRREAVNLCRSCPPMAGPDLAPIPQGLALEFQRALAHRANLSRSAAVDLLSCLLPIQIAMT